VNLFRFALMLVFSTSTLASVARAEDGCVNPKTAYDQTYCNAKLFLESDKELNEVYKDLKGAIDKATQSKLTATQKKWIVFRDESCSKDGTISTSCNFKVNKERTEYLRDRLRECKTGHCNNEAIAKTEFKSP